MANVAHTPSGAFLSPAQMLALGTRLKESRDTTSVLADDGKRMEMQFARQLVKLTSDK